MVCGTSTTFGVSLHTHRAAGPTIQKQTDGVDGHAQAQRNVLLTRKCHAAHVAISTQRWCLSRSRTCGWLPWWTCRLVGLRFGVWRKASEPIPKKQRVIQHREPCRCRSGTSPVTPKANAGSSAPCICPCGLSRPEGGALDVRAVGVGQRGLKCIPCAFPLAFLVCTCAYAGILRARVE